MSKPLVHIGYHKTGTSWLQAYLFDSAERGFCSPWPRDRLVERIVLPTPLVYSSQQAHGLLDEGIERAERDGLVPVLSTERFSGNPHSGGYDSAQTADRLAGLLPNARILAVVREQRAMIVSCYKQYVRAGGAASARSYLHPPRLGRGRVPLFDPDFFCYDLLLERYRHLFGEENVLLLPFESLRKDPCDFVDRVTEFAGGKPAAPLPAGARNVALSAASCSMKRWLNLFLVRDALNPAAPVESRRVAHGLRRAFEVADRAVPPPLRRWSDARLRRRVEALALGRYRESNRRLAEMIGVDLAPLGYET